MTKEPLNRKYLLGRLKANAPVLYSDGYRRLQVEISKWISRRIKNKERMRFTRLMSINYGKKLPRSVVLKDNRK